MKHATSDTRPRATRRPVARGGRGQTAPPADAGLAVLSGPTPAGPVTVATTTAWAYSVRRYARFAVWTLPVYALAHAVVTFGWHGHLDMKVSFYADRASADWFRYTHLIGGPLAAWLGLVALISLTSLLVGVRSRRSAVVGLASGLAGTVVLLPVLGTAGFVQPALALAFLRGDSFALAVNSQVYGLPARVTVLVGSGLYSLGWLLLGWAVLRSRILNRADGVLLMIAAPLVGIGGALAGPLRTVGALLVLAAGIGLAVTAARLVPAGGTAMHRARAA